MHSRGSKSFTRFEKIGYWCKRISISFFLPVFLIRGHKVLKTVLFFLLNKSINKSVPCVEVGIKSTDATCFDFLPKILVEEVQQEEQSEKNKVAKDKMINAKAMEDISKMQSPFYVDGVKDIIYNALDMESSVVTAFKEIEERLGLEGVDSTINTF